MTEVPGAPGSQSAESRHGGGRGKLAISVASGMRLLCVGKNKNKHSFLQTSCKAEPPGANMCKKGQ